MILPENYQNEILNAQMGNRRQYQMIENNNNTVSFIDVTVYDQEGSLFDADDINDITTQINLNTSDIAEIIAGGGGGGGGGGIAIIVTNALPTTNIMQNVIYLVPSEDPKTKNVKDEYINLDGTVNGWELIGSTKLNFDLTQYYTKTEVDTILQGAEITVAEFEAM